jgi:hypothetical protein
MKLKWFALTLVLTAAAILTGAFAGTGGVAFFSGYSLDAGMRETLQSTAFQKK